MSTCGLTLSATSSMLPRWGGNQIYFDVVVAPPKHKPAQDFPPIPAFVALPSDEPATATERLDALFPRYIHEPPKGI